MKKWLLLLIPFLLLACVGQKEDPDEIPDPDTHPEQPGGEETGTRFFRRVLALEFTATWCQYCPNMHEALLKAMEERPGRFVEVAVHQYDEMSPAVADELVTLFSVAAFPSMVFDWDVSTRFTQQESARMITYLDGVLKEDVCGIAVESQVNEGTLEVQVKVKAVKAGEYSVFAALVEDNILATQAGAGENYACQSVLRRFLGEGYKAEGKVSLSDGQENAYVFKDPAPDQLAHSRIVACVLKEGKVQNAVTCGLNQQIHYTYEED